MIALISAVVHTRLKRESRLSQISLGILLFRVLDLRVTAKPLECPVLSRLKNGTEKKSE